MLANYIDKTADLVANASVVIDVSNWDYVIAHFVSPTGTINITASNDSGDVEGSFDGNAVTATNFSTIQATKLSDGTAVTSVSASGLYKFNVVGRYIKFSGTSASATKLIIMLAKIS